MKRRKKKKIPYEKWVQIKKSGPVVMLDVAEYEKSKKSVPLDRQYLTSKEFLESYEWRKLRMLAIKKYGARCQCCGATPKDGVRINVDHIKPRRTNPELALEIDNLQVLCEECNHGKGNWDQTDWR